MKVSDLLTMLRSRLRDSVGADSNRYWSDYELIDDYSNVARTRLFSIVRSLLVDSTTAADSQGLPLSEITIVKDTADYAMSPKIIETTRFQLASQSRPIPGVTQCELDQSVSNWRNMTSGVPYCYVTDYETDKIFLVPPPNVNDVANLTNRIYPLAPLTATQLSDTLGFRENYHDVLIPGILFIAFDKKDPETMRLDLVAKYDGQFLDRANDIKLEMYRQQHRGHTNRCYPASRV